MSNDEKTIIGQPIDVLKSPSRKKRACLVQYSGMRVGRRHILDENQMAIGRLETSSVSVQDPSVSRKHAQLTLKSENWELEDLGSANGTFIHETAVKKTMLKHGDMIRFGSVVFKFFADGSDESSFVDNIYRKATIDPTTGVFNKQYLKDEMDSHFKMARNYKRPLTMIVFDLDFFRNVNNDHGHLAGDFILKECAQIAKSTIRKNDILGRFGGEEFVIILPDTKSDAGFDLAERIRKKLADNIFTFDGKPLKQTTSLGVAELVSGMSSVSDLFELADQKLYNAKKTGRNRVSM